MAKSRPIIAPLLRVIARPKITMAATALLPNKSKGLYKPDLRSLNFAMNKAMAAKKAINANEPAEFLVVKKARAPLE